MDYTPEKPGNRVRFQQPTLQFYQAAALIKLDVERYERLAWLPIQLNSTIVITCYRPFTLYL